MAIKDLDKTLIICPDSYKAQVLEELYSQKMIVDVKFMTLEQYRKKYYFDHDIKAEKYLKDRYGLSIANAREILDNLYCVDPDEEYEDPKLIKLVEYRKELDEKGLLIYDPLFISSIKDRMIIVTGYGLLNKEDERIIKGQALPYEFKERKCRIACFEQIEEEVAYLYAMIEELLRQGVDINDIYVLNATKEYEAYFKRFNEYYGFKIAYEKGDVLLGCRLAKEMLEMIEETGKEEIYEFLNGQDEEIAQQLISIINKYPQYDLKEVKDFIIDDLSHAKADSISYRNVVNCVEIFHRFKESDHVFLLGFNDKTPAYRSDIDYISDKLCAKLGKSTSQEANALLRENVRGYLSQIENLNISYCQASPFEKHEFCNLLDKEEYETFKPERRLDKNDEYNRVLLGYMLDDFNQYGVKDEDLAVLYNTYSDEGFYEYDNRFKGLVQRQLDGIDGVRLSYSNMDKFYKCAFAYYIENILGLNEFSETFYTKSGTLCHEVLKDLFRKKDFDFESSWKDNYAAMAKGQELFENEKELFFIDRIKEELKEDVKIILAQKAKTGLDRQLCEKSFNIGIDDKLVFKGFIDKVMYRELDDEVIVDVIDYKTGSSASIKEKLMDFGLSLQLPSYMYLLRKDNPFNKKISYGGFYLQHLINSDRKFDEEKDLEMQKLESMKLEGYTSSDMERMQYCDKTLYLGSSEIIKGLRLKKDGSFHGASRTKSDFEMEAMIENVEDKIAKAKERIFAGDFRIDPKQIDGVNESCGYCPYEALCYKRYSDLQYLSTAQKEEEDA